jgi:hypothetical protein
MAKGGTRRSIWKVASVWGLVGFGIAVFFSLFFLLVNQFTGDVRVYGTSPMPFWNALDELGQSVVLFVWPTSFWLMVIDDVRGRGAIVIWTMAVLGNFVLYFLVGLMLTAVWRGLVRIDELRNPH